MADRESSTEKTEIGADSESSTDKAEARGDSESLTEKADLLQAQAKHLRERANLFDKESDDLDTDLDEKINQLRDIQDRLGKVAS